MFFVATRQYTQSTDDTPAWSSGSIALAGFFTLTASLFIESSPPYPWMFKEHVRSSLLFPIVCDRELLPSYKFAPSDPCARQPVSVPGPSFNTAWGEKSLPRLQMGYCPFASYPLAFPSAARA